MDHLRQTTLAILLVIGCSSGSEQPAKSEPVAPAPEPTVEPGPAMPALLDPADPNEACGQMIVVSYKGAEYAEEGVTRDKAAAQGRATELLAQARKDPDFEALAQANSDAPSSAPRGGIMGTYTREKWPELHGAMQEHLFGLKVNQVADKLVEANYGYLVVRRCPVEKATSRHILIRHAGAKRAPEDLKRSKEDAQALAIKLHRELTEGADFARLAMKRSEDSSAQRGGELGSLGRGRLAIPFEAALFGMKTGELSTVVETEFGYHIIQRLPDP